MDGGIDAVANVGGGTARWWRNRGYRGDPFRAPFAEAATSSELRQWITSPRKGRDPLDDIISNDGRPLVIVYANRGGGKTFYRRLAALSNESGASIEIVYADFLSVNTSRSGRVTSPQLAQCVRKKIQSLLPAPIHLSKSRDLATVLLNCNRLAQQYLTIKNALHLYIFMDGLDRICESTNTQSLNAITDFLTEIASGASGNVWSLRVFLPTIVQGHIEGIDPLRGVLSPNLTWSADQCIDMIDTRLENEWDSDPIDGEHRFRLLDRDTEGDFTEELRRLEEMGKLTPRHTLELLSEAVRAANGKVTTEQIPKGCLEVALNSLNNKPRRNSGRFAFLMCIVTFILLSLFIGFLVGRHPELMGVAISSIRGMILVSASFLRRINARLAAAMDSIGAFLLLITFIGGILFVAWCLWDSNRRKRRTNVNDCLREVWAAIRKYLPGGS